MDPGKIVSLKLTREKIRDSAEEFRKEHVFDNSLPVYLDLQIHVIGS